MQLKEKPRSKFELKIEVRETYSSNWLIAKLVGIKILKETRELVPGLS